MITLPVASGEPEESDCTNRPIRVDRHSAGLPAPDKREVLDATVAEPADGPLLVRSGFLSVDPTMRQWIAGPDGNGRVDGAVPQAQVGHVVPALGIATVAASSRRNAGLTMWCPACSPCSSTCRLTGAGCVT